MTKKLLLINIIFSQGILVVLALGLKKFLLSDMDYGVLLRIGFGSKAFFTFFGGSVALLLLQLLFHKYLSKERLFDEINIILLEKFSLPVLFVLFLGGAFAEEFLFRGIIQPLLGVWLTSFVFTIIHFRYLRKIFILLEVFLMGLILGVSYELTSLLWVPILCHFTVNFLTAILIKAGYLEY